MAMSNGLERQLEGIFGSERVLSDSAVLKKYSEDQSFTPPRFPQLAVYPETTEEVQQIVRLANVEKFTILPYSSGAIQQGTTVPVGGGVIVDLTRMNRISDLDDVSRTVNVEPGVTFAQLQEEAQKYGLKVCTAVGLPASASVLTSYLEFTPLYSWSKYGTWFLLPFEVVLPTGEKMGTGAWSWSNASSRAVCPMSVAAGISRIFCGAQGTLGIAVKGKVTLKNLYQSREVYFIPCNHPTEILDLLHRTLRISSKGIGEECFIADTESLFRMTSGEWAEAAGAAKGLPPWAAVIVLSGKEKEVAYQREDLADIVGQKGMTPRQDLPGIPNAGSKILKELMSPTGFYQSSRSFYNPLQFFISGKLIGPIDATWGKILQQFNYPSGMSNRLIVPVEKGRVYYCEYGLRRDKGDAAQKELVRNIWLAAATSFLEIGVYFNRPYGPLSEMVYSRAGLYHSIVKEFKSLFDPNGIMNTGRI